MAGYFKANDFIIPAPDAHVAHYLKNTKPAREQLVGVVRGFAFITIEPSDAQGMQYRFSQLKGKRTVDPDHFAQLCKTHLLEFLNSYTTNKHTFPPGIIQQVEKKNPAFFQNNTAGIFIACYRDNNHVLICGRKEIVEDKMSFLSKLGIERSPVQSAQTVDIQATDIHVAMFLKNSAYHLNKMKEHMKHLGKVFIKIRGKNDVQYQVNLEGQNNVFEQKAFQRKCEAALNTFLRNYSTEKQIFDETSLAQARSRFPIFFAEPTTEEKQNLFVKWYPTQVVICGEKHLVDEKRKDVQEIVNCLAGSSISTGLHEFVKAAADKHVGIFVQKHPVHKTKLEDLMKYFAQVTLQNNDGQIEFHCQPKDKMDQSTFKNLCETVLTEFESDYTTEKVNFASGTIAKLKVPDNFFVNKNPELFERWYKENDHVILCGLKQVVQKRLEQIQRKIGTPLQRSTGKKTYSITAPNKSVALFIKKSPVHMKKLQDIIGCQGSIEITEKEKEYMFTCSTDLEMDTFEDYFETLLLTHLENYEMEKIFYNSEDILRVYKQNSAFFDTSKDENKLYVHWYRNAQSPHVVLIGPKKDMEVKKKEIERFFKQNTMAKVSTEETNEHYDKEDCKLFLKCEILKKTNKEFTGRLKISCFPNDERLIFTGSKADIKKAKIYMDSLKENLISKQLDPQTDVSEPKISFLQEMLKKHPLDSESKVQTTFTKHHVKGVLTLKNPKELLFITTSESHFKTGCSALESIIHCLEKNLPHTLPDSALHGNKFKEFISRQVAFNQLHAVVTNRKIFVLGFEKDKVKSVFKELDKLLDKILDNAIVFKCSSSKASVILKKFNTNRLQYPMSISIKKVFQGVEIRGSKQDIQLVLSMMKSIKWEESLLSFRTSNLSTYIQSNLWKSMISGVCSEHLCEIEVSISSSQSDSVIDSATPSTSLEKDMFAMFGYTTTPSAANKKSDYWYGPVAVSVCQGDITKQTTTAIVNGCVASFDLQKGDLSPYILKCAGAEMHNDIKVNPLYKSSTCRVTDSYKLPCKMVIHVVTQNTVDGLFNSISTALSVAEKMKCTSIALPTLGSGGIGLPVPVVAKCMAEVFELFASTAPVYLKKIVLVVFESAVVQNFVNAIKNQVAGSYQQQPQVNLTDILKDHKAKMNKHLETIDVLLTADQKTNIQKAEKAIQAHMNSLKCEIKDDIIGKIDDDAILDIVKKAIEYKAVIVFDKTKVTVDDPLLSVIETAHQDHSNFRDYIYCYLADLREGLQLKKTCIWQYRDNGNIITIPPAKSLKLEKQLEKNSKMPFPMQLHGKTISIDLEKMKVMIENNQCELLRTLTNKNDLPPEWRTCNGIEKITLETTSAEYQDVLSKFKQSGISAQVIKIERLQNPGLYRQFKIKEREVQDSLKHFQQSIVRQLFHGTSFEDAEKIIKEGFDRSFAGKKATAYGRGVYFAVESNYSARYCRVNSKGYKVMFLANVITGEYCVGHSDLKVPPEKPGQKSKYDSTVDREHSPRIFVVYKDSSAYASYLITFM